jgi:hypothetical protein
MGERENKIFHAPLLPFMGEMARGQRRRRICRFTTKETNP